MAQKHTSGRLTAVLGPTNTGKTHLAVERMLGHTSGMIGCPLRLLAREIYDKVAKIRGAHSVALITGEEKIRPQKARYYICTTEAMPRDLPLDFVAIDEIQMAADPERGHVFTDRILHSRGISETMFLGASTMSPLLKKLVRGVEYVSRPRFSKLTYAGEKKIARLPPRTAIVAFSSADVYMLAESIRRLQGGAAVVLGALSPRTRNAQVEMFQAGEVDYIVATDAIGMGLNLDVNHVAFAEIRKFDGQKLRDLAPAEIAQIAGRAGRHMRDGTFGTTTDVGALNADIIESVEQHTFPSINQIYWRNYQLDFKSIKHLCHSLDREPPTPRLMKPKGAEDYSSLRKLITNSDILLRANSYDSISLLWDVCCIPDFQKMLTDEHVNLLTKIYLHLSGPESGLPGNWVQKMAGRLNQTDGDIDTLATRIAHIRTWNYIAHRPDWVSNPTTLQEQTKAIEDRLSDALHKRLTQKFVDLRAKVLVGKSNKPEDVPIKTLDNGQVLLGEEHIGDLSGLDFIPCHDHGNRKTDTIARTIRHVVKPKIESLIRSLSKDTNDAFCLTNKSQVIWRHGVVGQLLPGRSVLKPKIVPVAGTMVDGYMRNMVRSRLEKWILDHIEQQFSPVLIANRLSPSSAVSGITFRLLEGLGNTQRKSSEQLLASLTRKDKEYLAKVGVRIGTVNLYMPAMLKNAPILLRDLLWKIHTGKLYSQIPSGRVSLRVSQDVSEAYYPAIGYHSMGPVALRVDILERLAAALRRHARRGPFCIDADMLNLCGTHTKDFEKMLGSMGYSSISKNTRPLKNKETPKDPKYFYFPKKKTNKSETYKTKERNSSQSQHSPFSVLQSLGS